MTDVACDHRHTAWFLALAVATALMILPAATPAVAQASGSFDGDPATTERIDAGDPVTAAVAISADRFDTAPYAVLATTQTFADSLAGAALSDEGPLLLTDGESLTPVTAAELDRLLPAGATVYVLGGTEAIGQGVIDSLNSAGYQPVRLAGETRIETAVAVGEEVLRRHPGQTALLARSDGAPGNPTSAWADSMTGGSLAAAAGLPILVTPTEALHPAVADFIQAHALSSVVLLGGEAALAPAVRDAVPGSVRLAGPERTATAAAIADSTLWPRSQSRRYVILDGARADGWAYGLSAAGIAADAGSPPLLVSSVVTPETRRLVSTCGTPAVDLLLVGDSSIISTDIADQLTAFDGSACADEGVLLKAFNDCSSTLDYFVREGLDRVGPYGLDGYYYGVDPILVGDPAGEATPAPDAPGDQATADGAAAADSPVSDTNVQEVGVDEPDVVKATASAAYVSNYGGIEVMDLTGDAPQHVTTLPVPEQAYRHELLLDDGILLVLSSGDGFVYPPEPAPENTTFAPQQYFPEPLTFLTRYDISSPTNPVRIDQATLDGSYRSARMVDGVVHVVASANPTGLKFTFPEDSSPQATQRALDHNRQVIRDSTIDNWLPSFETAGGSTLAAPCGAVFAPPAFSGISTAVVVSIDVSASLTPVSSAAVVAQAETLYASTQRLVLSSSRWGAWNPERPSDTVTTEVHSFDISDPQRTSYVASGQVDGYVLNSFSISERNGYYRIATTTEPPFTDACCNGGGTDNGITILTEGGGELFEVGRVFGLGVGERIFAVRYLGDVAAVITFRQVDPLYLVDLTNPAAPRVTGELKIPGVSRYLHPLGADYLLGVGQEGDQDGRLLGLQVSLFNIADPTAPTRVDSIEYGPGNSPVEFDHKAFLLWGPLGRAFVPADLYESGSYGVQAIDIDTVSGTLNAVGQLSQPADQNGSVQRSFVVGDTVYAVGYGGIGAYDLVTLAPRGFGAFPQPQGQCCVAID